jgi:hypothetical protein
MGFKAGSVAKGDRGFCDVLFSRIVRNRARCQRCGAPGTDTAHIVGRRYSATRCLEDNAWCLCRRCHQITGEWPEDFLELVGTTIGHDLYERLRWTALEGIRGSSALFWASELERLKDRCRELGLDARRRPPA